MATMMIEGQYTSDSIEATALRHAEIIGMARAIEEIINEYKENGE